MAQPPLPPPYQRADENSIAATVYSRFVATKNGPIVGNCCCRSGARVVFTSNAGCHMQIAREARMQGAVLMIVHPMDLLDLSYRREPLTF